MKYIYSKKEGNLLLLHGDQENIQIVEPYWKSVLTRLLALPQSSQIQFSDGFVWDDIERKLKGHYVYRKPYSRKYHWWFSQGQKLLYFCKKI